MILALWATDTQYDELKNTTGVNWLRVNQAVDLFSAPANGYFYLAEEPGSLSVTTDQPVFVSSSITTLQQMGVPANVIRINGWSGFLQRSHWELAGQPDAGAIAVLTQMQKTFTLVTDEPGFVADRVLSMIINEAYHALGDGVSTREDIDIAMQLGTNYPYGPFAWAQKIGLHHIHALLALLSQQEKRYTPAPALEKEVKQLFT